MSDERQGNTYPKSDEGEGTEDVELHGNTYPGANTEPSSKEESDDDVQAHMKGVQGGT